ncbi:MAG: hypothetical protein RBS09_09185, partial [Anaerolineaceae bacterium]|nr:hypothetical protein [Anaerolineaceae bacterium]
RSLRAIQLLLDAGVKTNIHYVLGKNSIDEAITRLETDDFPKGINGLVLLLHKPVGLGASSNVLSPTDERVARLFKIIDRGKHRFKVGMDSCSVPGVVNFCENVIPEAIDSCEGGSLQLLYQSGYGNAALQFRSGIPLRRLPARANH